MPSHFTSKELTSLSSPKAAAKLLHFFELYKFLSLKMKLLVVFSRNDYSCVKKSDR